MPAKYSVISFSIDSRRGHSIPVGVALWSTNEKFYAFRVIDQDVPLNGFDAKTNLRFVRHVKKQIERWASTGDLPYPDTHEKKPWEDEWWAHVRSLLVHELKLSEPIPVACAATEEELNQIYELVIAPHKSESRLTSAQEKASTSFVDLKAKQLSQLVEPTVGANKSHIVAGMRGAPRPDTLSVRIMPRDEENRISLRIAPVVYASIYGLFAFAASLEKYGSVCFQRIQRIGSEFAANLWLTPAEQRSFAFDIESVIPNDVNLSGWFLDDLEKTAEFRRNVMVRVVRGLSRCRIAYDNERWEDPANEHKLGLNANMAEALVAMYNGIGVADVEFGIQWSTSVRYEIPEDIRAVRTIYYTNDVVKKAHELSGFLRHEGKDEPKSVHVHGAIFCLKDKKDADASSDRDDWVRSVVEQHGEAEFDADRVVTIDTDGKDVPTTVHFSLGEHDYRDACNAHRDKKIVWARGQLQRRRGKWILDPCEAFGVISAPVRK